MASTKPIVHLRVYKSNGLGTQISRGEDGKIQNENHAIKEIHNTIEYNNFLKYIGIHGFIKVEVEKVVINGEEVKDISEYQKEVDFALKPEAQKELTADQKAIEILKKQNEELNAKLDALLKGGSKKEDDKKNDYVDETLSKAREEYVKVFGKKGHHSWSVEQINEKIAEEQNKA